MNAASVVSAPDSGTDWLVQLAGSPLPARQQEDWRFTDLAPLQSVSPAIATSPPWRDLQLPAGVTRLSPAAAAPYLGTALAAVGSEALWPVRLNMGAAPPLLALRVQGEVDAFELPFEASPEAGLVPWRILLVLDPGARLQLLECPIAAPQTSQLLNGVMEVVLGPGARLHLGTLAQGTSNACLFQHMAVRQSAGSELMATTVTSGWSLVRQDPRVVQEQGRAHTQLRALQRVVGREIADTHSTVRFDGPEGQLDQLHKSLADGAGRSVFSGVVQVPRSAQQTKATQISRNLLLSERARIDTKPELQIVADDVKCAHGATVTQLQPEELFYLQSRGVEASKASQLLQRGFCDEVLRDLPPPAGRHQPVAALLRES